MRPGECPMWRGVRKRADDSDHDDKHNHHEHHDDDHHDEHDHDVDHHNDHHDGGHDDDNVTGGAMTFHLALIGGGFVSFVLAAANAPIPRVNLVALGLALVTLAQLV